jgi:hypothetical protein
MANIRINAISGTFTPTLYTAPTAISAAGNTNLTLPAVASDDYIELDGTTNGSRKQLLPRPTPVFNVTVSAGSAAYTATITAQTTSAVAGDEMEIVVAMPASFNPLVELHDATSGGTLLATFVGNTVARTWVARIRFTGTAWFLAGFSQQRAASIQEVADLRNALALAGAVVFDGTASAKVQSALTNQNIATDALSVEGGLEVPSSNPAAVRGLFSLASSASDGVQANAIAAWISTANTFVARIYGAATTDYSEISLSLTPWAGKRVRLALTRTGSTVTLSINGVAQTVSTASAGTPPTWAGSVTSTYFNVGFLASATPFVGALWRWTFANLQLSASDVQEIFELNGAVPYRFQFGGQALLNTGAWQTTSNGFAYDTFDGASATGFHAAKATGGTNSRNAANTFALVLGKAYGLYYDLTVNSGAAADIQAFLTANFFGSGQTGSTAVNPLPAGTGKFAQFISTFGGTGSGFAGLAVQCVEAGAAYTIDFTMANIRIVRLGAVVHLPLDDGLGFELQDVSTNKLHAIMTATGVSHVVPSYGPANVRTTTNTNGNQQLFGQVCIPANAQIIRVRARAQSNTPTVTLGTASGGSQVVASIALSTVWKDLTIALTGGMVGSSNISLWAGSNSTDVVEWDVKWEPLSP